MKTILALAFTLLPAISMAVDINKEVAEFIATPPEVECCDKNPTKSITHDGTYVGDYPTPSKELAEYMKGKKCVIEVIAEFDEGWGPTLKFRYYCEEPCGWNWRGSAHVMLDPDFKADEEL